MTFGTLALIAAIGLLGPLLALLPTRLAPPAVIGEIAAGVAFGATGTHTINASQPTLAFLADIGFALLMFIVGTKLPLRDKRLVSAASRGAVAAGITIALALAFAPLVVAASGFHRPAVLAVLLASSSAAVVGPVLQSAPQSRTGLLTLAWVTILDIVTVLAVPVVLPSGSVTRAIFGAVLVIVAAGGFTLLAERTQTLAVVERLRTASRERGWAIDLRLSLFALFVLAWIAESFDTSVLIAGFAAGAMVAIIGEPRRLALQLIGLGEGFFVPLYFVVLGARIDMRSLFESSSDLWLFATLVVVGVAIEVMTALIMRISLGHGLLATARLGVPAAVASIGLASHVLRPGQGAAIIGAAAVSLAVASIGASMIGGTSGIGPRATPS